MTEMKSTMGAASHDDLLQRLQSHSAQSDNPQTPSQQLSLGTVFGHLRRNALKIFATTLAALALASAYLLVVKPVYTSTAELFFDPARATTVPPDGADVPYTPDFTYIESQISVIKSPVVLNKVVAALHLADDRNDPGKDAGALSRIGTVLSDDIKAADPAKIALANTIDVTRKPKTYVVTVSASSTSPTRAAAVVDAVLNAYLAEQRASLASAGAATPINRTSPRLIGLQQQLRAAEAAAANFAETAPQLISGSTLEKAHAETIDKKARYDQIQQALKAPKGKAAVVDGVASLALQKARDRLAAALQRVTTLSTTLGERHPDLIEAKSQVTQIKSEIDAELKRMLVTARADLLAAEAREEALNARRETPASGTSVAAQKTPSPASSEIATLREQINAEAAALGNSPDVAPPHLQARVLSPPSEPTQPSFPRPKLVLGLGLLSGLGLGLAWVAVSGAFDSRVHTRSDFGQHLESAKIANIPFLKEQPRFLIPWPYRITPEVSPATKFGDVKQALDNTPARDSTGYRQAVLRLLAKIKAQQLPGRPHVVMLVAPRSGAGNSTTALALAQSAALAGERVLLVDATSINTELSQIFAADLKSEKPVVLDSKDDLNAITTRDATSGLLFLPIALADLRTLKTPQRRRLVAGINGLSQNFDLVFIDAGAVLEDEAATSLLPVSDQVIVVAKAGETTHSDIATTLQLLEPVKAIVTIGVLTMVANQSA